MFKFVAPLCLLAGVSGEQEFLGSLAPLLGASQSTFQNVTQCVAENCVMDAETLAPTKTCVAWNCAGQLGRCAIDSTCRRTLKCVTSCPSKVSHTEAAPMLVAATACITEYCPGAIPSKYCIATQCALPTLQCAWNTLCREALLCTAGCFSALEELMDVSPDEVDEGVLFQPHDMVDFWGWDLEEEQKELMAELDDMDADEDEMLEVESPASRHRTRKELRERALDRIKGELNELKHDSELLTKMEAKQEHSLNALSFSSSEEEEDASMDVDMQSEEVRQVVEDKMDQIEEMHDHAEEAADMHEEMSKEMSRESEMSEEEMAEHMSATHSDDMNGAGEVVDGVADMVDTFMEVAESATDDTFHDPLLQETVQTEPMTEMAEESVIEPAVSVDEAHVSASTEEQAAVSESAVIVEGKIEIAV